MLLNTSMNLTWWSLCAALPVSWQIFTLSDWNSVVSYVVSKFTLKPKPLVGNLYVGSSMLAVSMLAAAILSLWDDLALESHAACCVSNRVSSAIFYVSFPRTDNKGLLPYWAPFSVHRMESWIFMKLSAFQTETASWLSRPIVGSDESCDRAVKLVGSWEFLNVLFNKLDGQSYW